MPKNRLAVLAVAGVATLSGITGVALGHGGHGDRRFSCGLPLPHRPRGYRGRPAEGAGVPINTEIGLLIDRLPTGLMTIGVTGSVGKSTTTSMIEHTLRAEGFEVLLGGNIGKSLLEMLPIVLGVMPPPKLAPYIARHVDSARISRGRAKYQQLRSLLSRVEAQTGVQLRWEIKRVGEEG